MKTNDQIILEAMASRIRELEKKLDDQEQHLNKKINHEQEVTLVFQRFIGEKHFELSGELADFTLELCTANPYDFERPFNVGADALNFETDKDAENKKLELAFKEILGRKNALSDDQ